MNLFRIGSFSILLLCAATTRADNMSSTYYAGGADAVEPNGLVPPLPNQIVQPLPDQLIPSLPNELTRSLPGQLTKPLSGQVVRSLEGQNVGPLPGQIVRRWVPHLKRNSGRS